MCGSEFWNELVSHCTAWYDLIWFSKGRENVCLCIALNSMLGGLWSGKNDGGELGIQISEADVSRPQRHYFIKVFFFFFRRPFSLVVAKFTYCMYSVGVSCAEAGNFSFGVLILMRPRQSVVCLPFNSQLFCSSEAKLFSSGDLDQKCCGTVCECWHLCLYSVVTYFTGYSLNSWHSLGLQWLGTCQWESPNFIRIYISVRRKCCQNCEIFFV